jgi:hypothetical protein
MSKLGFPLVLGSAEYMNKLTHEKLDNWALSQEILKAMVDAMNQGEFGLRYKGLYEKDVELLVQQGYSVVPSIRGDGSYIIQWGDNHIKK